MLVWRNDCLKLVVPLLNWLASEEVKAHFAIEQDGSFMLDALMIEALAV